MAREITQVLRNPFVILSVTLCAFVSLHTVDASEPKHEYEKPGFNEGHAYDGILPEETIDLFTGGLSISQRDVHLESPAALDAISPLIMRRYSSKIYRQTITGQGCQAMGSSGIINDDFVGQGSGNKSR